MKKGKTHTPGPWTIGKQSNDEGESVFTVFADSADGENKHLVRVASSVGWTDVNGKTHRASRPAEANARLIAAAPEMLELLKAIYKAASDGEKMSDGAGKHRMLKNIQFNAAQAIAKAEGRES